MSQKVKTKQSQQPRIYLPSKYLTDSNHTEINYDQFCYHPSQIHAFIDHLAHLQHGYKKDKVLKWIAFAAFCQPVLVSSAQNAIQKIIGEQSLFTFMSRDVIIDYSYNLVVLLQALNIFCLVKGFSLQLFNINKVPMIHILPYAQALWNNCLPFLSKNALHSQCELLLRETKIEQIMEVKQMINKVYTIKQKVTKSLVDNNYFLDSYSHLWGKQQTNIHSIDIQLSKFNCLVSADYLPEDYKAQYIQVWINRTVQLNSLLGNFVCMEKFGEFQYVKGPLTYAMEKGIMLVLNNFQHISNQLLVGMRTLAQEMKIFHNQKTVQARGGFKILGICSAGRMSAKMKNMISNSQYIAHIDLPKRTVLSDLPKIENQSNRLYLTEKLLAMQNSMGLIKSKKLWKRIQRARTSMVQSQQNDKLWQSYFTQGFKDMIELEIADLNSVTDKTRTIHHEVKYNKIVIGRTIVNVVKSPSQKIVKTQYSLSILERLALCSQLKQTPLLISETGCGKTTLVQYLAQLAGHHLFVYNMSSGTDVMDLVGGFKPVDCRSLLKQLFFRFIEKFRQIPGSEKNQQYLQGLMTYYNNGQLKALLESLSASITKIKINKVTDPRQIRQWDELKKKIDNLYANLSRIDSNLVFSFMQGNLIKALRNGDWVLIDQINMATNDVLQKIVPLIEGKSLLLYEKGDLTYIERHQDFRIIACMNPANDSGKKPLPPNLMQKFTVINLPEPQYMDIQMMVKQIAHQLNASQIADLYFKVKKQKTTSLRNLSRCLSYLNRNKDVYSFKRALYDALLLGFQHKLLLKDFKDSTPPKPIKGFTQMHGFLIQMGPDKLQETEVFHLTDTFLEHLKDFLRAIAGTELPVLLEGPTSAGKTSIIRYVASVSGHKCIRINNHEHTEIEEYLGNYFPDKQGKLIFRQGPLVQAVRQGHWLILDELNLARTQILQCLNRLLDDNRQLFIPEQQIHIKPHKNFRIFATQNPASYSGRKTLSRAFRNRFISLSFDDITIEDTMAIMKVRRPILNDSKQLSGYVKKTLDSLQHYRQKQRVFSKDNIITIRDLLKWTGRKFADKDSFMREGYALLTERLRTQEEKKFVSNVLFAGSKNQTYDMSREYQRVVNQHLSDEVVNKSNIYVQMNKSFKRMAALTLKAVLNNQPVLLVGETGCGKTTLAQLLASISGRKFYSLNCHKHTEASDLLGCLRPCVKPNSQSKFEFVNGVVIDAMIDGAVLLIDEINTAEDSVLQRLNQVLQSNNIGVQRGQGWETVTAKQGFCIIATMNPSGDYGKKELSPALRNRFTEIWVQPITHPQYIEEAKDDIEQMITHKLSKPNNLQVFEHRLQIADLIFKFIKDYNCIMAPKYSLTRKLLTMRDIGWICKFMSECQYEILNDWQYRYYWALRILAIQGVNFMMGDLTDSFKLNTFKQELIEYIDNQISLPATKKQFHENSELEAIQILKQLSFPLLIKTDLPLELLGINPDQRIFFSPHTQLTDLLGQFRPRGTQFIWKDQTLLKTVKNGQRVALMDLNLAQQPVVEGINSLFDHRGSIFVVELNEVFVKNPHFKAIVVLKQTGGSDRRGLPNSFLNRFIKIRVKDVSKGVKIKYLKNKYEDKQNIDNKERLWKYIQEIIIEDPKVRIQMLQYVCSLYNRGQPYLQKAIKILKLPPMKSQTTIYNLPSEEKVLRLLPMREKYPSHNINQADQIDNVINSYITLNYSKFSVCLIGNVSNRENIVQMMGYLLGKSVVKVILSTMTDMADLLGSYEQVQLNQDLNTQQNSMQEQLNRSEAEKRLMNNIQKQNKKYKNRLINEKKQSTGTNFRYIQSRIIKTLNKYEENILYIEVPNEMMLERVEKGLKIVYEQKVNIIVGLDNPNSNQNVCSNTKFIPIYLNYANTQQMKMISNSNVFKPNYTNLIYSDEQIRKQQTQAWIQECCEQESNRKLVKGWQRLYRDIKNGIYSYANASDQQQIRNKKVQQIVQQTCKYMGIQKLSIKTQQSMNSQQQMYLMSKNSLRMCSSKQHHELMYKIITLFIHEILTSSNTILRDVNITNEQQHRPQNQQQATLYNTSIGHKFQFLYVTDFSQTASGGFREQAYKLLSLCYQYASTPDSRQIMSYNKIIQKFFQQTQNLYNKASSLYQKQILIKYNEQEHKIIPILTPNCRKSIYHYALANIPYSINKLAGLQIDFSVIAKWQIERQIINYMGWLAVDLSQAALWLDHLSVRDLPVYHLVKDQVVINHLDYFTLVSDKLKNIIQSQTSLWNMMTNNELNKSVSPLQFAHSIFKSYKPSSNQYLNLCIHIQTESELKALELLCQQDKFYLEVYKKLCEIKYNGYKPNSFKCVEQKVTRYNKQYDELKAKRYIYRGYDNLKLLKDFYQQFTICCQEIQSKRFDCNVIRNILNQLYRTYYHQFKDILWPIFVSLIIIHTQGAKQNLSNSNKSITQALLTQTHSLKSFQQAIKLIMHKEEEEFHDAAKNYTKYQRKFKNTVIVDEYTEEAVKKHKQDDEQQFRQFFGKSGTDKPETILDQLYMLVRKRAGSKFQLQLLQNMFSQIKQFYSFVVAFELKFSNIADHAQAINSKSQLNIYEQYSLAIVSKLTQPIPKILNQTKNLLSKYNIDSVRIIGTLCNKIQEHKAHQQIYKILIDCQFLITKVYEVNSVLPMAERIGTEQIENLCLNVRRIELKNWKSMLNVKINRIQKSDTLDFIQFYRSFVQIGNIGQNESIQGKECFRMCDDFMKQSKISCYQYRLYLLGLVSCNIDSNKLHIKYNIDRIINFYTSLRLPIMEFWETVKKQKIKQMNQYEKLVKWDSNRYLVFKQGCEKFQKKIHNILKKYQEQLSMQVGLFHSNLRNKHICQSIQQFSNIYKMKEQSQRVFESLQVAQQVKQTINVYEGVIQRIFESLEQIKQEQHNTQSKLLLIRNNLDELQELSESLPILSHNSAFLESQVLSQQMFPSDKPEYYQKAVKYYFGMWDKLCQKTQTAWNRQVVERVWAVAEKIWVNVNSRIPKYSVEISAQLDEETDNILILFDRFLEQEPSQQNHHPIFIKELQKIKNLLRQKQKQFYEHLKKKFTLMQNIEQTISLMKIGYIVASIALNLQKNGLCVKQNQQQGEQSGTEEVGDGVGIGEGQAHEGAENVGDQIEFQEQIQGNKGQQKNEDANANKKQQNDIEMQGDFEGDLYSKEEQEEDNEQQGQQKQPDQKMGSVDNQQRQQDMKNEEGRADGQQQADIDIDGQQQGSQQLVDNEKEQKQARKGQKGKNQQSDQDGQEQKSDWDDNNEQGQKINKQNQNEMQGQQGDQGQEDDGEGSDQERSGEQEQKSGESGQQESNKQEQQNEQLQEKNSNEDQRQEGSQEGNQEGQIMQQEINQQPNPPDEDKQKRAQKTKRTNIQAFGRSDVNSNNPLKNDQNQMQNEDVQNLGGAAQAQGAKEGQKGNGDPVHSLSAQLLKQIQNLERITAKQNANFMKDLNVVAHDQQYQQIKQGEQNKEQQYELTDQDNKMSTNLPAFMDDQNKKMKEEQKKQKQKQKQGNKKERKQQKQFKKQQNEKKNQQKKSKIQKTKGNDKHEEKLQKIQEMIDQQQQKHEDKTNRKEQNNKSKASIDRHDKILQISNQEYLKSIVNTHRNQQKAKKQIKQDSDQQKGDIMDEAFQISKILEEQLKSVLQPMDNAQYRGDYKTGKKLNLKKIIPFIASNFRKDKIWLRRTEPSQRNYYIMLALDDTKSMKHGQVGSQALKGLLAISLALQHLSIKTCITGIRDSMNIYKNFQQLLEAGKIINNFDFSHESQVSHDLSIASFMSASLEQFKKFEASETGVENKQLCFIISDGKMNKDYVRPYLRQATKRDIIYVFIIVDSQKASIMSTKSVAIGENGKVTMKLYLSDFPFQYFLIVRNVRQLGDVLATTLLQFIQQK